MHLNLLFLTPKNPSIIGLTAYFVKLYTVERITEKHSLTKNWVKNRKSKLKLY